MKIFTGLFTLILLSACSAKDMRSDLDRGMGSIPKTQYSNAQSIEEIRALRPQARIPLKIAVMITNRGQGISQAERTVIDQLAEKLKQIGFVKSLELIPNSLIPSCGYKSESKCFMNESRAAGARLGADAILFLSDSTVTDAYVNPLNILNLTIIGMWLVPAHHRESYSVYEAALFDIDNGYLYAVAEGRGEHKTMRPYMYVNNSTGQEDARINALSDVTNKLYGLSQEQMRKLATENQQSH